MAAPRLLGLGTRGHYPASGLAWATRGRWSTGAAGLPAPQILDAIPGDQQVELIWDVVSGATSYNLYRSLTSGSGFTLIYAGALFTFTDTGLTNGTTYYYKVAAVNAEGEGALSAPVSATPAAPTGLPPHTYSGSGAMRVPVGASRLH